MARCYIYSCFFVGFVLWLQNLNPVTCGEGKLVMVNVVYRHGDRSPTHIFPTDPYQADAWPQGLGQLTQKGMRGEYGLGKMLKERYMEQYKLLNSTYINKELYIRSTDMDRALMSAQTQLNGLYPPHGNQIWRNNLDWQPIGIHTVPKDDDYLLRPFDYPCPRFYKLHDEDKKQPSYIKMSVKYKDVLAYVSENSGEETDVSTAFKIRDPLICEEEHDMPLPDWVLKCTTYEDIGIMADFSMKWNFNTLEKARLTGGALVGRMIENMKLAQTPPSSSDPVKKAYLYSAHDTTIAAFLSALDVFDGISPFYSSAVVLELFRSTVNGKPELSVRIVYRYGENEPHFLTLPGCEEICPLEKFIELTADVIPENVPQECALEKEKCTCEKGKLAI